MTERNTYVFVNNNSIIEQNLPDVHENISGFQFQDEVVHNNYGFFKAKIITPEYNASQFTLVEGLFLYDEASNSYIKEFMLNPIINPDTSLNISPEQILENKWRVVKEDRYVRLQSCDWTELPSVVSTVDPSYLQTWYDYRLALRAATDVEDPDDIVWPTPPHSPRLGSAYPFQR